MLLITSRHRNATRMFLERQLAKVVVSELIFTGDINFGAISLLWQTLSCSAYFHIAIRDNNFDENIPVDVQ